MNISKFHVPSTIFSGEVSMPHDYVGNSMNITLLLMGKRDVYLHAFFNLFFLI